MSKEERIVALKSKHHTLENAIQEEEARPHPDETKLHALKKEKLKIKDEIAAMH